MPDLPALIFEGLTLAPVDRPGGLWLTASQVGMALFGNLETHQNTQRGDRGDPTLGSFGDIPAQLYDERLASRKVRTLYRRYADQFDDSMTAEVTLPTSGGSQKTRIFSADGCICLALLARTEQGRRFRFWLSLSS